MLDSHAKTLASVKEALEILSKPLNSVLSELRKDSEASSTDLSQVESLCDATECMVETLKEILE